MSKNEFDECCGLGGWFGEFSKQILQPGTYNGAHSKLITLNLEPQCRLSQHLKIRKQKEKEIPPPSSSPPPLSLRHTHKLSLSRSLYLTFSFDISFFQFRSYILKTECVKYKGEIEVVSTCPSPLI